MKSLATILALILVVVLYQVDEIEGKEKDGIIIQIVQKVCESCQPVGDENLEDNDIVSCDDGFEDVEGICQDIDECSDNVNPCSVNETCMNTPGNFDCNCNEGFRRVGDICEDECTINDNPCGVGETCVNKTGNWNCSCTQGFARVKGICEDCASPSLFLEDLGCISLLNDQQRSWNDSKIKCQMEGKRLLEGIKQNHLQPLKKHFHPLMGSSFISSLGWIGMQLSQWITSGEVVDNDDDIWMDGEPNRSADQACNFVILRYYKLGLGDVGCHNTLYAFCQSLP